MSSIEDHTQLLDAALACKSAVAISGYPSDLYDTLLHTWHRWEIPARTGGRGARTRAATEILWVNRPPTAPRLDPR